MRFAFAVALALLAAAGTARAQDRFPILQPEQMNAEQKKLFETIIAGPRAANYGGEAVQRVMRGGPVPVRSQSGSSNSAQNSRSRRSRRVGLACGSSTSTRSKSPTTLSGVVTCVIVR